MYTIIQMYSNTCIQLHMYTITQVYNYTLIHSVKNISCVSLGKILVPLKTPLGC